MPGPVWLAGVAAAAASEEEEEEEGRCGAAAAAAAAAAVEEEEDEAGEEGAAGEEPCLICQTVVHRPSYQLPRVRCLTCRHGFHAACIYRWWSTSAEERGAEAGEAPKCPHRQVVF